MDENNIQEQAPDVTPQEETGNDCYKNMKFTLGFGCARGLCKRGVSRSDHQLNTYDWLADVP